MRDYRFLYNNFLILERVDFASQDPMDSEDQQSDNADNSEPPSTDQNEAPAS